MEVLLLLLLLLNPLFSTKTSAKNTSFEFNSFSFHNLTLLGDSYLNNGSIGLTLQTDVPSSSSGAAAYNLPVQFHDPDTNSTASFSTKFSFKITNPNAAGDGLTFFISPRNHTIGSPGARLGLFAPSSSSNRSSAIAVEFDTRFDPEFHDMNANHIGFDKDCPDSLQSVDATSVGVELGSGNVVTAWIDFDDNENRLEIWLGYSTEKPQSPTLTVSYELGRKFHNFMYVGFSASTEGSSQVHTIESWSFRTFGFHAQSIVNPSMYESSNIVNPPMVKPGLNLAVLCTIAFSIAFVALCCVILKKWIEMKLMDRDLHQKLMKTPRRFGYREIRCSTNRFHSSKIIGNGAFGTVYQAVHPRTGITYAVKQSKHAHENEDEFIAELSIIASLRHKNLVQLEGWCAEKGELFLVYEFMPNGSLDKLLYTKHQPGIPVLNWSHRHKIAVGIASVLSYPRLGDFGLARLMAHNESPISTLTAVTMGYLAPEYLQYGKVTEKTDVFSYGVVVLEICCGKRAIEREGGGEGKTMNLVDWVWRLYSEERLIEAADRSLKGQFVVNDMKRLLLVGLSCANPDCSERPTMRKVFQILNHEAEPMAVPRTKPMLVFASSGTALTLETVSDCEESKGFS